MDILYSPEETKRVGAARESFSGVLLSDRQYNDAMVLTGIIERRILETGAFKDPLSDFANAFARTERFDAMKADSILRDLFRSRTGMTMNQMREMLMDSERKLFDREQNPAEAQRQKAYMAANETARMVKEGTKMSFHRAFAHQAAGLARDLNITDAGAKKFIKEVFAETENQSFHDYGKTLDEKYFRPQIKAEQKQRQEQKAQRQMLQPAVS